MRLHAALVAEADILYTEGCMLPGQSRQDHLTAAGLMSMCGYMLL